MTATPMISWPRIQYGLRLLSALRRAVRVLGSGSMAKIMVGLGPRGVRQNPTIAVATRRSLAPAPGPMSTVKFARACTTWPKSERYEPNRRQDHPLTNLRIPSLTASGLGWRRWMRDRRHSDPQWTR